jgi:chromosome segregation ATPase
MTDPLADEEGKGVEGAEDNDVFIPDDLNKQLQDVRLELDIERAAFQVLKREFRDIDQTLAATTVDHSNQVDMWKKRFADLDAAHKALKEEIHTLQVTATQATTAQTNEQTELGVLRGRYAGLQHELVIAHGAHKKLTVDMRTMKESHKRTVERMTRDRNRITSELKEHKQQSKEVHEQHEKQLDAKHAQEMASAAVAQKIQLDEAHARTMASAVGELKHRLDEEHKRAMAQAGQILLHNAKAAKSAEASLKLEIAHMKAAMAQMKPDDITDIQVQQAAREAVNSLDWDDTSPGGDTAGNDAFADFWKQFQDVLPAEAPQAQEGAPLTVYQRNPNDPNPLSSRKRTTPC